MNGELSNLRLQLQPPGTGEPSQAGQDLPNRPRRKRRWNLPPGGIRFDILGRWREDHVQDSGQPLFACVQMLGNLQRLPSALGELLAVAAPCCLHSSSQLRTAAARALRGAAAAVGAEAVEEELNAAPASVAAIGAARAALQATESGPAPIRCAPSAARSSPLIPDCAVRAEVTPGPSRPRRLNFSPKPSERGCERSVQRSRRSKSLVPVQVDAQSPAPEGTRDASELEADIEAAMEELAAGSQLTESTDWPGRISMLRMRLQEIASRSCNGVPSSLLRTMLVLLWRLALGAEASESEELSASLLKAVCEAAAACRSFPAEAFVGLGTGAPFQCLLQTLACLQTLSQQSSAGIRRASGPALLELPPLLAQTMDAVEADSQFVAWLRVATASAWTYRMVLVVATQAVMVSWYCKSCNAVE
ncbi:unnamed protein product [Symbiodinium microadriaticum]|nr:unnamed protein product [Symbiodinium microadriaticum]